VLVGAEEGDEQDAGGQAAAEAVEEPADIDGELLASGPGSSMQ
jgi:hypothetical protein